MITSATRGETLTPNPTECNSTLTSGTNNIYPYPYIDINDRGHRLRITHTRRPVFLTASSCLRSLLSSISDKDVPFIFSANKVAAEEVP